MIKPDIMRLLQEALLYKEKKQSSKVTKIVAVLDSIMDNHINRVSILSDMAFLHHWLGNYSKALSYTLEAIAHNPHNARLLSNAGFLYGSMGKYREAMIYFDKALTENPHDCDARCNRYHLLLKLGLFAEGFKEMEHRFVNPRLCHFYKFVRYLPAWKGESFVGKRLLVYHEQGFGDSLMFIRYLSMAKARGGTIILSVPEPLLRLFSILTGYDTVIIHDHQEILKAKADYSISLMSLPHIFGTEEATIPAKIPYLKASKEFSAFWQSRIPSTTYNIGLVWSANAEHCTENFDRRTCSPDLFAPLAALENITLYSLQVNNPVTKKHYTLPDMKVIDLTKELCDFADTAALIANLDLVISVDTAVAHLAGALGKPVWVLLPFDHSWRWPVQREDSPWYPTAKIFRQPAANDWNSVIAKVISQLETSIYNNKK